MRVRYPKNFLVNEALKVQSLRFLGEVVTCPCEPTVRKFQVTQLVKDRVIETVTVLTTVSAGRYSL